MPKRGQVTVFIIVGILILAIVGALIFSQKKTAEPAPSIFQDSAIKQSWESCLEKITGEGMDYIGSRGGYYITPESFFNFSGLIVPIYFSQSKEQLPNREMVGQQLNLYLIDHFAQCQEELRPFEQQGFTFSFGEPSTKVMILPARIRVDWRAPLKIGQGTQTTDLNDFSIYLNLDFDDFFSQVEKTWNIQRNSSDAIPLGALMNLAYQGNYHLETDNLDNQTILYSFFFVTNKENPYIFSYAIEYPDWSQDLQ